jgi:hypothetical protein
MREEVEANGFATCRAVLSPTEIAELLAATTNIYAEVDLEMKAKALATCEIRGTVPLKHWKEDLSLMQFLQAL